MERSPVGSLEREAKSKKSVEKKRLFVIDTSDSQEKEARDIAEAKLTEERAKLKGIKGFAKRVWKYNWVREITRQNEISKARAAIEKSGNLFAAETADTSSHEQAMQAIIERFGSEYEEALHTEGDLSEKEKKEILDNDAINGEVKKLVKDYASGLIDEDVFVEEKARIFSEIKGLKKDVIDKGSLYASNLLEIAKESRQAFEHGTRLQDLDLDFEIIVGKARTGVRTEANFNSVDRIVEKLKNNRVGALVNETTLATAVATAYTLTAGASRRIASSRLAAWGTFGASTVLGSGLAMARESTRLEEERRQHGRERAKGKEFSAGDVRRAEMEKYRIETKDATTLTNELENLLYETKVDSEGNIVKQEFRNLKPDQFKEAIVKLAEVRGRIRYSDQNHVDLIRYSDAKKVEVERTRMDLLSARSKVDLEKFLSSKTDLKDFLGDKADFNSALEDQISSFIEAETRLNGDSSIEKKNELFSKMKRGRVAKVGLKTLFAGIAIGATAQEVASLFREHQIGLTESVEDWWRKSGNRAKDQDHYTALAALVHWIKGDLEPRPLGVHEQIIGDNTYKITDNLELRNTSKGFDLYKHGDLVSSGLVDKNGQLVDHGLLQLRDRGILSTVNHHLVTQDVHRHIEGGGISPRDYLENKGYQGTKHITRDFWYDEDTPKVFEKNELKLWWGGVDGNGIDEHGNFVYNIKHMSPDGSYHGKFSTDAQELIKEGKVKMLLSLSRDTQNQVFEVPIDQNGNAIIDPNSEVGKLFFQNVNGHAKFIGKFAEVAQMMGPDKNGVEHVRLLATDIGHGMDSINAPIDVVDHTTRDVQIVTLDSPSDYRIDPPPFIPIIGRYPLEPERKDRGNLSYGYYYSNPERLQAYKEQRSETLNKDPDANLNAYQEMDKYLKKKDPEYIAKLDNLSKDLQPMLPETRVAVCIPVAGHQEGEHIYRALESYTRQNADKNKYELVLYVNYPERDRAGNRISPDKTLTEINRFKADYPDMHVQVITEKLSYEDAKIGNIRATLSDIVIRRQLQRGENAPELIMVSNDADNVGIAPEYISNFIELFDNNPNVDAMLGQLDWDPRSYVKNPLLHISNRFFQYMDVQGRAQGHHGSSGANFAYRATNYAAVNGYDSEATIGEDVDFGARLREARRGSKNHRPIDFAGARKSRVYSSSRRAEKAINEMVPTIDQWQEFGPMDELRKAAFKGGTFDFGDAKAVAKLVQDMEVILNKTLQRVSGKHGITPEINRTFSWLGIKYIPTSENSIKITDASKLIEGLKAYQTQGLELFGKKSGRKEVMPDPEPEILPAAAAPESSPTPEPEAEPTITAEEMYKELTSLADGNNIFKNSKNIRWSEMEKFIATPEGEVAFRKALAEAMAMFLQKSKSPSSFDQLDQWARKKGIGYSRKDKKIILNNLIPSRLTA